MMNCERRFGALARVTCARTCALFHCLPVALFGLLLGTGPALAADAAHARPRHGAQSAGTAEARGHVVETALARRSASRSRSGSHSAAAKVRDVDDVETPKSGKQKRARGGRAKDSARDEVASAGRRRGGAKREIVVEDAPVMPRAEPRRARMHDVALVKKMERKTERKTWRSSVEAKSVEAKVVDVPAVTPATKKAVTVDDFVKAANGGGISQGGASKGDASQGDAAQGVAHPDEREPVETADVQPDDAVKPAAARKSVAAARSAGPAQKPAVQPQKPAPVERVDVADVVPVVAKPKGGPQVGVSFSDAPAFADLPHGRVAQDRVVQGFGGEVDVLPSRTAKMQKGVAPISDAELDANGRALERELNDEAMKPVVVPLYTRSGKLMVPAPLKGTREILVHQNTMADQEGLSRIQDDEDLNRMRAAHLLLPLPEVDALDINSELPVNRRYARPWTVKFVSDIARAYYARFHEPLYLSSAVRTVAFQLRLQRVNGNAAAVDGDTASPHLTGQAIDFAKGNMSRAEIAWMRAYLLPVMQGGKIDVEEEFQQACFHISVYSSYAPKKKVLRQDVAEMRNGRE